MITSRVSILWMRGSSSLSRFIDISKWKDEIALFDTAKKSLAGLFVGRCFSKTIGSVPSSSTLDCSRSMNKSGGWRVRGKDIVTIRTSVAKSATTIYSQRKAQRKSYSQCWQELSQSPPSLLRAINIYILLEKFVHETRFGSRTGLKNE